MATFKLKALHLDELQPSGPDNRAGDQVPIDDWLPQGLENHAHALHHISSQCRVGY